MFPATAEDDQPRPAVLVAEADMKELEEEFAQIVIKLFKSLNARARKQKAFIDDIRTVLLAISVKLDMKHKHHSFFQAHIDKIENATTVAAIQHIVCDYCDFLNISLIDILVGEYGDGDLKTNFKIYAGRLRTFQASTKLDDFVDVPAIRKAGLSAFIEVQIELDDRWRQRTLKDAEDFLNDVCKEASLNRYTVCVRQGGEKNSIILLWCVVKSQVSSLLYVLSESRMKSRYFIQLVKYDEGSATLQVKQKAFRGDMAQAAPFPASHPSERSPQFMKHKFPSLEPTGRCYIPYPMFPLGCINTVVNGAFPDISMISQEALVSFDVARCILCSLRMQPQLIKCI